MSRRHLLAALSFVPLLALAALGMVPTASASWEGEDARGDAAPPVANAWADLVSGVVDGASVRIAVGSAAPAAFGTAFVALYDVEDETRFCAAVEDRVLLGYTGTWDVDARAPADARAAEAQRAADGSPAYELDGCDDATNATAVSFLALDAKPAPLGLPGIPLDEMQARDAAAEETLPAPAPRAAEEAPAATSRATGAEAAVPAGALAIAAIPLAAVAGALLGGLRARGRA